jgi:hypothetical protein
MEQIKSFFAVLLDFSFKEYVTTKVLKVLYGLSIAASVIVSLGLALAMSAQSSFFGKFLSVIIVAPILAVVLIVLSRTYLEVIMAIFRIAENTDRITGRTKEEPEEDA